MLHLRTACSSACAPERSHYQIIWLLSTGKSVTEVAEVTGYSKPWIYEIMARYNEKSIEGLGDLRKNNQGKEPLLSEFQQAQLHQILATPPADGGLWNGRKVAEYMSQITGKEISRVRGWEYLKQMEYTLKVPRPQHLEVSLAEQLEWKKRTACSPQRSEGEGTKWGGLLSVRPEQEKLSLKLKYLQALYPNAEIEVWAEDEQRIGLQPILRRVWTPIGEQPTANVKIQYKWIWLYGFVHPESGETYWWILPQVNTELFSRVLADFANEFQLNRNKRVLLVLDKAGWHISKDLIIPEGLDLYFLPSHSPELQPAERLWPKTNEIVSNSSPRPAKRHER